MSFLARSRVARRGASTASRHRVTAAAATNAATAIRAISVILETRSFHGWIGQEDPGCAVAGRPRSGASWVPAPDRYVNQ